MKICGRPCLLMIFCCCVMCASAQFRKYSNEFLNIGAGARGLAMGGAQVASAEDGNVVHGVTFLQHHRRSQGCSERCDFFGVDETYGIAKLVKERE